MLGLILDLLTLPALGPPKLLLWLADNLLTEAEGEFLDEGRVRGELLELQQLLDAGDIDVAEYDREEEALLERLNAIREVKASSG